MKDDLEAFGEFVVSQIRDAAISDTEIALRQDASGPTARRWREAAEAAGHTPPEMIIGDAVDSAIFYLLHLMDNGHLRIQMVTDDGEVRPVTFELGELAGDYLGVWREKYSKKPVFSP